MWSFPALGTIVQDLRYAVRTMRSAPAFTLVATLSLGVGMGGAAAVFGLADSLLLRELPVSSPRQLAIFRWSSGPVATLLGAVTLLLAAIGLYGLMSYSVTRRVPELGLRMALGASRGTVMWLVLRQSLLLAGAGLIIGIPAALASGRFVSSLRFDISPRSPMALMAASTMMLTVALIATLIHARRASRVDPMIALIAE